MFAIERLADVPFQLSMVYNQRLGGKLSPEGLNHIRGPVGLFLVRKDGAAGSKLAEEVVGSFQYWHARTAHYFDGVFLGWGYDQGVVYMGDKAFAQCVEDLEAEIAWKYEGGSHLILTDFVYSIGAKSGLLDFSRTIALNISALMEEKKLRQLSHLIEELRKPFREQANDGDASVLLASDYLALLRAREQF